MSLKSKVLAILDGATVARIRFRFPIAGSQVTIAPQTFHRVARKIRSGAVHVGLATDLAAGVGAQYNIVARTRADGTAVRANTLELKAVAGRLDGANVVHESLHAAYDLLKTGLDANSEEASAMVCTALYCRMTGLPKPRWATDAIFSDAERAAQSLLVQYQRGTGSIIPMVGATEWRDLRLSVALHPVYLFGTAGIFGILQGAQYPHDG